MSLSSAEGKQVLNEALKQIQSCGVSTKPEALPADQWMFLKGMNVETVLSSALAEFGVPDVLIN